MTDKTHIEKMLSAADIRINGDSPWDIEVHNADLFSQILAGGSLALGEAYMDGWWDCQSQDEFFFRALKAKLDGKVRGFNFYLAAVRAKLLNLQSKARALEVGRRHYDLGNHLFKNMLDRSMTYSCGYWRRARDLDEAQEAKYDLICRKIGLREGMKVLDIGCGWGGFAKYAAERYNATVTGITVSKEQAELVHDTCRGLPVLIRLQDYRALSDQYDMIVSIGMFEHVGAKNYTEYMRIVHRCLKDGGLFLLHTIGSLSSAGIVEPWIDKYIFPNGMLPSLKQIAHSTEGLFVIEDVHNFGADYDKTLMAWYRNYDTYWSKQQKSRNDRFYRMWTYYLLSSAGGFRARKLQVLQIVLSKNGVQGGYTSVR